MTGATYMVMDADAPVVESGGKTDFEYGNTPTTLYRPTKVDRVLHDGDEVRLGGTVLVAHLTPVAYQRLHNLDDGGDRAR